jgi:serine/threonine protein kinase
MLNTSQYRVASLLGQGGMAKVYLAEHKTLGHKVAIKVLNKEYFHNDNIRKRFLAEAKSLAGMNHPNIVRVADLIEENESAAFVMEYIEGRTLRNYLEEKGKLSDDEIKHLFGQMLDAVGYVHEQGLIHRDIKPSNFMLDGRGNIKLLDFGIAKAADATSAEYTQTGTGVQMGTPMYMSPEQIVSTKAVTTQSDIYSLGVVLWQMVSGMKPYDIATLSTFQIQSKIVNEPLPKTGTGWDELIGKATEKSVEKRYSVIVHSAFVDGLNNSSAFRYNFFEQLVNSKTKVESQLTKISVDLNETTTVEVFEDNLPEIELKLFGKIKSNTRNINALIFSFWILFILTLIYQTIFFLGIFNKQEFLNNYEYNEVSQFFYLSKLVLYFIVIFLFLNWFLRFNRNNNELNLKNYPDVQLSSVFFSWINHGFLFKPHLILRNGIRKIEEFTNYEKKVSPEIIFFWWIGWLAGNFFLRFWSIDLQDFFVKPYEQPGQVPLQSLFPVISGFIDLMAIPLTCILLKKVRSIEIALYDKCNRS